MKKIRRKEGEKRDEEGGEGVKTINKYFILHIYICNIYVYIYIYYIYIYICNIYIYITVTKR
jgi:hypothetical protein